MKSYNIHLIRHGAIEETYKGKYIGVTNPSLSEEGKKFLKEYDYEYKYPYAQVLFSSPLRRCTETAKIIYPNLEPVIIDDFTEMNFGEWEGKTAEDLKDDETFKLWLAGDNSVKPPRGESGDNFTRRICLMFESVVNGLIKSGMTDSVIITHGGVIMTLLSIYGLPQAKPFDWVCDNGFGYSLRVTPMLWQRDKVCEVYAKTPVIKEDDDE